MSLLRRIYHAGQWTFSACLFLLFAGFAQRHPTLQVGLAFLGCVSVLNVARWLWWPPPDD